MNNKYLIIFILILSPLVEASNLKEYQSQGEEFGIKWNKTSENSHIYADELRKANPFVPPDIENMHETGVNEFQNTELGQFANEQRTRNPGWAIGEKDRLWSREMGQKSCEATYMYTTCLESPKIIMDCIENLHVDQEAPPTESFELDIFASSYSEKKTTFYLDLKSGTLTQSEDAQIARAWSNPQLSDYHCRNLSFSYQWAKYYNDTSMNGDYHIEDVQIEEPKSPSCLNNLTTSFTISQKHHNKNKWKKRGVQYRFKVTYKPPPQFNDKWLSNCIGSNINALEMTQNAKSSFMCIEGPSTKNIGGFELTRDCWKRKRIISHLEPSSECKELRNKGCEQIKRRCVKANDKNICSQFENSLRCPTSHCEGKIEPIDVYCQTGDCVQPLQDQLGGFEEAISHLGGALSAGKGLVGNEIFKGKGMSCRTMGIGFSDCCKEHGWGQDLRLTECKQEEKLLGEAKQASRVIEIGEFCDNKVIGECVERKKVYCVYPSKIAKIIQQGTIQQFGRSLGTPENPSCPALTPEDLQALDWNKLDFSELYDDIKNSAKFPNKKEFAQKIQETTNRYLKG